MAQFDAVASQYARWVTPKFRPVARLVADRVAEVLSGTVVELSTGTGLLTSMLAPRLDRTATFVGLDVAHTMLVLARDSLPEQVSLMGGDVRALPLRDASVDLVVSSLGPVQDTVETLSEVRRVLRPGGTLVLTTWGPEYSERDLLQRVRTRLDAGSYDVATRDQLRERLHAAGLADRAIDEVRLDVVHDSVEDYIAFRAAFGRMPWLGSVSDEEFHRNLRAEAEQYTDSQGRVHLDWTLLALTACR